jgi:hypothetical protein
MCGQQRTACSHRDHACRAVVRQLLHSISQHTATADLQSTGRSTMFVSGMAEYIILARQAMLGGGTNEVGSTGPQAQVGSSS